MPEALKLGFGPFAAPAKGVLIVFCSGQIAFGPATRKALGATAGLVTRAAKSDGFTGKSGTVLELVVPDGLKVDRLIVIGASEATEMTAPDLLKLGGQAMAKIPAAAREAVIFAELPSGALDAEQAADLALGARLRGYAFERYKTKRKDERKGPATRSITIVTKDAAAARKSYASRAAVGDGVVLARDLVNEPANILYPAEFARRVKALEKVGLGVEVLDAKAMKELGMNALLGVGQGSAHESRVAVMRWNGGKRGDAPVAFIGKGVCFDTGGISIKPAGSMEDMKGDMAGAACVTGLMLTLAARKARVNAVGLIGLVENMPGGNAQRPGDIVTSMSGQTIEIINTDAEGRLVLADVIWYAAKRFKPKFMIDLATLTGAIIVALGHEYAGMFCNNDELAERLTKAGAETGDLVWRMPLAAAYDKMIDSKFADVKNTGGSRYAGAITAAHFIKRFVDDKTPWAHLDIAGTGFDSSKSDINQSWGSGWGVRLLDRLVRDYYEG
ncbi:MAG TPA: leucyl aminopeptidase [Pseudolabrys sp.]|nr:leucyl aminopeptidase [Pseudolabrys sp.]